MLKRLPLHPPEDLSDKPTPKHEARDLTCILCLKAWRLGTRSLASDVCEHGIVLTEERRPTLYVEIKKRTLVIASKPGF